MKFLLASYGGGHVNIIVSLYHELRSRGYRPVVLGFTMARVKLKENNIPFLSFADFFHETDRIVEESDRNSLFGKLPSNHNIPANETEAYLTLCFNDLVRVHGIEHARYLWNTKGRSVFLPMHTMGRILKKLNPDVVIATNSPRSEKALLLKSVEMGIHCYCVNDFYSVSEMKDRTARNGYGNKIYVAFDAVKKAMIENGRNEQEILVSGNPGFDELLSHNLKYSAFRFRKRNMKRSVKVILWIKSVFPKIKIAEEKIERELRRFVDVNQNTVLVIKPHPNDSRKYPAKKNNIIIARNSDNIQILAKACDVVVTINSTAGLEAALLGKPVIQVDLVDFKEKVPFSRLNIGYSETSLGLMVNRLKILLNRRTFKSILNKRDKAAKIIVSDILSDRGGIQ